MIVIPLLNYYDIPVTTLSTFLVAPPPPPPPPPPAVEVTPQRVIPKTFSTELTQPNAIPDKIAIIQDEQQPRAVVAGVEGGDPTGVTSGILEGIISTPTAPTPPPPPPPPPPVKRIPVGGAVQEARMVRRTTPVYPPLAKSARVQGVVKLSAVIGTDGKIKELKVIDGPALLIQSAMAAVQQWEYQPTLLNQQPVEVATQINVVYSLGR
jgi:protein TonB